jgi:hypothetical protein
MTNGHALTTIHMHYNNVKKMKFGKSTHLPSRVSFVLANNGSY